MKHRKQSDWSIILSALIILSVTVGTIGVASAATSTEVNLSPTEDTVNAGSTVTYDIVVEQVDNGVESYEFNVSVNETNTAKITDFSLTGSNPSATGTLVTWGSNNDSLEVAVASGDHNNGVIASITVTGENAGTAALSLSDVVVGDTNFTAYTITSTGDATVTVSQPASNFEISITSVSRTSISQGDSYSVTANVTNTGTASGTQDVTYELSNATVTPVSQTQSVTLSAGSSTTITYRISGQTTSTIPTADDYSHTVSPSGAGSSDTSTPTGGFVVSDENKSNSFLEVLDKNGNNDGIINFLEVLDAIAAFNNDERIGSFDVGFTQVLDAIEAFNNERSVGS